MNKVQMNTQNRYGVLEHSKIEHFINDVKYATTTLNTEYQKLMMSYEDDILELDITSVKERFANEYETLFQIMNKKLHKNGMVLWKKDFDSLMDDYIKQLEILMLKLNQLLELQEKYSMKFMKHPLNTLNDLINFTTCYLEKESLVMPSKYWLKPEYYEEIRTVIDVTQTKVEDLQRAEKRILKVWNPKIFDDEYEAIIEEYQKVKNGNLKFLSTTFWKNRKQLRKLFIQDMNLLTEHEYEVLYRNRKIVRMNSSWLKKKESRLCLLLGNAHQRNEDYFEKLRQKYEEFHSFIVQYNQVDYENVIQLISNIFANVEERKLYEQNFEQLYDLLSHTKDLLLKLTKDFGFFHKKLRNSTDEYCLNDVRKALYLIERIQLKEQWLNANREKILSIFGTTKLTAKTDWKLHLKTQLEQEKKYQFQPYQTYVCSEVWDGLSSELFKEIIKKEQPVHEKIILKRAAMQRNLARITPSLKREYLNFLDELASEYEVVDHFIESKDKSTIKLRLPGNEKRELAMIADSELKAGILHIIQVQYEITFDNLSKIMCDKLGFQRRNQAFVNCIQRLMKELKREDLIIRHSAGWRLL